MTRKPTIHLEPAPELMTKELTVYFTQSDFDRLKALAAERGEKGVSTVVRKIALAALDGNIR